MSQPHPHQRRRPVRVLVAEDDEGFRGLLREILGAEQDLEVVGEARDGLQAVQRALELRPDVVTMDVRMPGIDGIEATRRLAAELPSARVVMFSALEDRSVVLSVVEAGACGFVVKGDSVAQVVRAVRAAAQGRPVLSERVTRPILEEFVRLYQLERARADELERLIRETTRSFAILTERRDRSTAEHASRVVSMARSLLREADPPSADDPLVEYGFLLHDVGKVAVPDRILLKPGPLTPQEWEQMRLHPILGAEALKPVSTLAPILPIVRHHHEHWDGSGYPDGLKGEQIPLPCRALLVADAFDAMTSDRPYRRALSLEQALLEVQACRGRRFDPELVDIFLHRVASAGA